MLMKILFRLLMKLRLERLILVLVSILIYFGVFWMLILYVGVGVEYMIVYYGVGVFFEKMFEEIFFNLELVDCFIFMGIIFENVVK